MEKKTSKNINKVEWLLFCLSIGAILGIVTWNMGLL